MMRPNDEHMFQAFSSGEVTNHLRLRQNGDNPIRGTKNQYGSNHQPDHHWCCTHYIISSMSYYNIIYIYIYICNVYIHLNPTISP